MKDNLNENICPQGAETNTQNNSNNTALHFARQRGHAEIAQLLLDNGAGGFSC